MHTPFRYVVLRGVMLFGIAHLTGCAASTNGPEVLTIKADQYESAFDAALEAARRDGLVPLLKDRRSGVIETDVRAAGSLLEPWRVDNASLAQGVQNTFGYQRRRARFEFSRAGFQSRGEITGELAPSSQASIPLQDLTQADGELELRVLVFVERANTPGVRRDTWSRRMTTRTRLGNTGPNEADRDEASIDEAARRLDVADLGRPFWSPVARDAAYERRLLATVEQALR